MKAITSMAAIAALAGLASIPLQGDAFARGAGAVGLGRSTAHGAAHGPARTGFHPHFAGAHFAHHRFRHGHGIWGWGGFAVTSEGAVDDTLIAPQPGFGPDDRDVPFVDFYNTEIYTGGPYGFPLGYGDQPPPAAWYGPNGSPYAHEVVLPPRRGCNANTQAVPDARGETSHITVVRC